MSYWQENIKKLTNESLKKALDMDDMELRTFFELKGSSECWKIRVLVEREYAKRAA